MKEVLLEQGEKLCLKNDGGLELFFIGVGSAFATTLDQTNFLIIKGGVHIMVDFGMTGPSALWKTARLKIAEIETILPSHLHSDHIGGLEGCGLINRYVSQKFFGKPKIKMIITEEFQRILWDRTLCGGMGHNEEEITSKRTLGLGDYFDIVRPTWKTYQPRQIFILDYEGIKIELFRTKHIPDSAPTWEASFISYGLFIDDRVFVSMDTRFDQELIDMYEEKSEVMFQDVQFFDEGVHAPLSMLKGLPSKVKSKMFLMHYSDDWAKHEIFDFKGWAKAGVRYCF